MQQQVSGGRTHEMGGLPRELEVLRGLLVGRHSVRAFRDEPVAHALVEEALAVAGRSPSWCNTQPWEVVITAGTGTEAFRAALATAVGSLPPAPDFAFPESYAGVYKQRRRETAFQLYDAVGVARGDREASAGQGAKNFAFFGAPHVAIVTTEADLGVYGAVDCGLFVGALLLAFHSVGVGAVPQAALAAYAPVIRAHFGLPDSRAVVCAVSFGWEDTSDAGNGFRTTRADPASFVTWFS